MNGWTPIDVTLANEQVIAASQTNAPISKPFSITAGGSRNMVVAIKASAVTAGAGITAKLQSGIRSTFFDSKTGAITTNGWIFIKLNVEVTADQTFLPLLDVGQVVLTTGAGSTATIDVVAILQEL